MPIIVLTAYDWSDIEEEARDAGITAFCSKPLFLSELRTCLLSVVNREETGEEESGEPLPDRVHSARRPICWSMEVTLSQVLKSSSTTRARQSCSSGIRTACA